MVVFGVRADAVRVHDHSYAVTVRIIQAKTKISGMECCFDHDRCIGLYHRLQQHHPVLLAFGLGLNAGDFPYYMETCLFQPPTDVSSISGVL